MRETAVGDGRLSLVATGASTDRGQLGLQNLNLQDIDLHQLTSLLRVKGALTGPGTYPARFFYVFQFKSLIRPSVAASGDAAISQWTLDSSLRVSSNSYDVPAWRPI